MAQATEGTLIMHHKPSDEIRVYDTINFSMMPGTSYMILVEKPKMQPFKVLDREGKEVSFQVPTPPLQRILDLADFYDIQFISDLHQENHREIMAELCNKANVDMETLLPLISIPVKGNS